MCDMKCGMCGYLTMLNKILNGNVYPKRKYCNKYDMWVSDVISAIKRGLIN